MLPNSEPSELTDPRGIRALAHPVRLAILELLQGTDTATATECAAVTGESPQSCSYHLRTLAKWGFVRRAESSDGRETRWTNVPRVVRLRRHGARTDESDAAARLLGSEVVARDERALGEYLDREDELDAEWRDAQFVSATVHLDREELGALEGDLEELARRYRRANDERRPGSRPVRLVLRAFPLLPPQPRPKGDRSP